MFKKSLSKGTAAFAAATLALGGVVGLAAPASAAELAITPSSGTQWSVPSDAVFSVKLNYGTGVSSAAAAKLKLMITTPGGFVVKGGTSATLSTARAATGTLVAADKTSASVTAGADLAYVAMYVDSASTTTSYAITVQAYEDSDGDGVIDAGEWVSAAQEIKFVKYSAINWTVALSAAPYATSAVAAKTAYITADVNMSQMKIGDGSDGTTNATTVAAVFSEDTATAGTYAAIGTAAIAATYNSTKDRFEATSGDSGAAYAAGDKIKVDVFHLAASALTDFTTAATTSSFGDTKGTAAQFIATVGASDIDSMSSYVLTGATADTTDDAAGTIKVRQDAGSFTAYVDVKKSSVGVAGVPVTFTVAETGNSSILAAAVINAGGTVLKNTNAGKTESITVTVTSDSKGRASLPITFSGVDDDDADAISISATAQSKSASASTATFTVATAASVKSLDAITGDGVTPELLTAVGSATALKVAVLDTFGQLATGSGYTVTATESSTVITAVVSGGYATLTWPADTVAASHTITLQAKKNGVNKGSSLGVELTSGTAKTPALVVINAGADSGLQSGTTQNVTDYGATTALVRNVEEAFTAADERIGQTGSDLTAASVTKLSGTVTDANGAAVIGDVTISGTGLGFIATDYRAVGSITVRTDDAGAFAVGVVSSTPGTITATVTAGAVSKTQKLKYAATVATDGADVVFTVPATALPSSAVKVEGKLVDAFGNAVTATYANTNFTVSYSGPGFVSTLPTETGADGTFSFFVLIGANDVAGTGTVTVKYDQNNDEDYADAKDVVKSASFIIGLAGNTGDFSSWTKKLDDNSAKMYAKNVVGEGKVQFFLNGEEIAWVRAVDATDPKLRTANGSAYLVRTVEFEDGKNVLEIYVDGVRTTRTAYTK